MALLVIAALAVSCYDLPGRTLQDLLVQSEIVVHVASDKASAPTLPTGVAGLLGVECSPIAPAALGAFAEFAGPSQQAMTHTCRFRFDMNETRLLSRKDLYVGGLIEAALGRAASSDYTYSTREVFLGDERFVQMLPGAVNLPLVVGLALWLGWRPLAEAAHFRQLAAVKHWPTTLLVMSPFMVQWVFSAIRRWGSETMAPLLWSISAAAQSGSWLASDLFRFCVAAPVAEELVYRVWLIPFLSRGMNPHVAVLLSAAAFSWGHGQSYIAQFAGGLAFGYVWLVLRNGLLCMAIHAAGNLGPALFLRQRIAELPVITETFSP